MDELLARITEGELIQPKITYPCQCGHGVFDHGNDPRDTSCTECGCTKFVDAQASL